jgi:hypothetical protein
VNSVENKVIHLPALVAHADWGSDPKKRWLALARRTGAESYRVEAPVPAGEPSSLLKRLGEMAGPGEAVLAGFDFPMGLPAQWAARVGVRSFLEILPQFGQGTWADFYRPAGRPEEISLRRPFYPLRAGTSRHLHLTEALGVGGIDDLRRLCDFAHPGRRAASPLFWTLGGQQVGKAAIHGWREVLGPGLRDPRLGLALWPFSGPLGALLAGGRFIAVETYPAECYAHLGVKFSTPKRGAKSGKRVQGDRAANARRLLAWAEVAGVRVESSMRAAMLDGFGPSPDGEDPFDTTIGLLGMLNVVLGHQPLYEPEDPVLRNVEGWIFGQAAE